MAIGVVGYTVRFHTFTAQQVMDTYAKIAAMGYDGVEGPLGRRYFSVEEELGILKQQSLRIAAAYGDLTKPDEAIATARAYGVNVIGVPSIPGDMLQSADGFYAYAERINELAKPFEGTGIRLQYHNHSQEFRNFPELGGRAGMDILIAETCPKTVCFELDTHWMAAAGCDPAQWIRKVKGRMVICHFKDYAVNPKEENTGMGFVPRQFAEVGRGNINWPSVVEACREAGVQWYCVEQDRTVPSAFESLKISIDYMRSIGVS